MAQVKVQAAEFARNYARPLWRMGMTANEIMPVGGIVSVIVAALLSWRRRRAQPG